MITLIKAPNEKYLSEFELTVKVAKTDLIMKNNYAKILRPKISINIMKEKLYIKSY